jgi:hypothetical protein
VEEHKPLDGNSGRDLTELLVRATNVRNTAGADETAGIGLDELRKLKFSENRRLWKIRPRRDTHHFSLVLLDELLVEAHVHEDLDGGLAHGITAVLVARELLLLENERLVFHNAKTSKSPRSENDFDPTRV